MPTDSRKTALVTGCSKGGIGDALAREFHAKGVRVLATGRNLSKLEHFNALGIETLQLDVENSESIKAAAKAASDLTGGKLDYLVNNSGMGELVPPSRPRSALLFAHDGHAPQQPIC